MEHILQTKSHQVWRSNTSFVVEFSKPHTVLSTSQLNGGIHTNIEAIFNNQIPFVHDSSELPGGSVPSYLIKKAKQLGLNPKVSTGLLTSASMENTAFKKLSFKDLAVEAFVTGGVNINGGRAGDPASYYEQQGNFLPLGGTINILLYIQANLPPEALVKSLITATEAKTAALQELSAPSQYSAGLATGSGTDGIIIACDPQSSLKLTDAGHHSKLGELIGQTVISATKKALALETGLSPQSQYNVLARLQRFKLDKSVFKQRFDRLYPHYPSDFSYEEALSLLIQQDEWVCLATILAHLQDQVEWGLIPYEQALRATKKILGTLINENYDEVDQSGSLLDYLVHAINTTIYRSFVSR